MTAMVARPLPCAAAAAAADGMTCVAPPLTLLSSPAPAGASWRGTERGGAAGARPRVKHETGPPSREPSEAPALSRALRETRARLRKSQRPLRRASSTTMSRDAPQSRRGRSGDGRVRSARVGPKVLLTYSPGPDVAAGSPGTER